jgi:putative ABC transport system permease protein
MYQEMKVVGKRIIRNFVHRPVINCINLFGLSVSLTLVIILSIYSYSELTTDSFHENVNEVFLLKKDADAIYTPGILAETIKEKIPGMRSVVRVTAAWDAVVFQSGDKESLNSDLLFADEEFFNVFTYSPIEGNLNDALIEPMSLVISESLAIKLFGQESAIGRPVKYNNDKLFTITAVFREQKQNSCLRFNAVTSIESLRILQPGPGMFTEWGWNSFQTFLLLTKDYEQGNVLSSILQFIPEEKGERGQYSDAGLLPLSKIYFSKLWAFNDYLVFGNLKKTVTLLMVAMLVLMIALVNFINISSSQWRERIRQFGVMKVLGASKSLIFREITAESFIFFVVALILAIELSSFISPAIHDFTGFNFNDGIIRSPAFVSLSVLCVLGLSIVISILPALRISSSNAIDNLKKNIMKERTRYSSGGALVTLQFAIAIALLSFTILVQKQIGFGITDLGINQDNILGIKLTPQLKYDVLRSAFEKEPFIDKISFSEYYPGNLISNWGVEIKLEDEKKMVHFDTFCADEDFYSLLGLQLISGRLYSDSLSTDKDKVVVNESFSKTHNIADPLGLTFYTMMGTRATVIGVVRDFHHKPMNSEISPLVIRNESQYSYCIVNLNTNDFETLHNTTEKIRKIASDNSPSFPVEVTFIDNAVQSMYTSELKFRRAFMLLAACALVISCLGILAMSISASQKRVKEMGIRRVNGARASEVLLMLNKDLIKWVVVALLISTPVSLYFMNHWLRNYAYKTQVSWWIFALSGSLALVIALISVSWQTLRAASRNPVEAIRHE